MTIWRPMRNILLALPEELIIELDEAAKSKWLSRSECIREILVNDLAKKDTEYTDWLKRHNPADPRFLDLDDS